MESEHIEKIIKKTVEMLKKGREREYQIYPEYYESEDSTGFTSYAPEILIEVPLIPRNVISALTGKKYTTFYNAKIKIYLHSYKPHIERHKVVKPEDLEQKLREILRDIDLNDIHFITVHLRKAPYSLDPTLNNLSPDVTRPFNPFLP